jgi:hypothetical protein
MTVIWGMLPCSLLVDWRFRRAFCLHHQGSGCHRLTRRRENLKSHAVPVVCTPAFVFGRFWPGDLWWLLFGTSIHIWKWSIISIRRCTNLCCWCPIRNVIRTDWALLSEYQNTCECEMMSLSKRRSVCTATRATHTPITCCSYNFGFLGWAMLNVESWVTYSPLCIRLPERTRPLPIHPEDGSCSVLPKRRITFNILRGSSPKAEILHRTPATKAWQSLSILSCWPLYGVLHSGVSCLIIGSLYPSWHIRSCFSQFLQVNVGRCLQIGQHRFLYRTGCCVRNLCSPE